ncbi:MAG: type II secretion system F family protein [Actinomycetota bacterium]|nr:type II secretion system F family protein [Actinomycetota bacterium]
MIAIAVAGLVVLTGAVIRVARSAGSSAVVRSRLGRRSLDRPSDPWRHPPTWIVRRATRAGLPVEWLEPLWPVGAVVALAMVVTATVLFAVPGLIIAVMAVTASPMLVSKRLAARQRRRRARALPVLLEDVARGLRSGTSLRQALSLSIERADVTLQPDLRVVCDTVANGGSLEAALEAWTERQPCDGLRLTVAALCLGIDAGSAHGQALDGVAASLRDRLAVQRELTALSSQARSSAGVMVVAPVLFAGFTVISDHRTAHFLLGTPVGLVCLTTGVGLDALAAWWMARITGAERSDS